MNISRGFSSLIVIASIFIIGGILLISLFIKKDNFLKDQYSRVVERHADSGFGELLYPATTSPTSTPASNQIPVTDKTISIQGDEECLTKTRSALELLEEKALVHSDIVKEYIGIIECVDSGSGMFAWENPPRYKVGKATIAAGNIWYAGTIVHDSCHSKQYNDYIEEKNTESVPSDIWIGKSAEAQCLDVQYDALTKLDADQETLDYLENTITTEYWNIDYSNRWW